MKPINAKITNIKAQESQPGHYGEALGRWKNLVSDLNCCVGSQFAMMAGLAGPFMHLVGKECFVINFFGGGREQREKLLRLALSCWTDPNDVGGSLTNISWRDGRTDFGLSYTLDAGKFSVEEIKRAASCGATRMAIVCGEKVLDEHVYKDASIGGEAVIVLNLDVAKFRGNEYFGYLASPNTSAFTRLARSFAGDFLMRRMREHVSRLRTMRNRIERQVRYEYEMTFVKSMLPLWEKDLGTLPPTTELSFVTRLLSVIEAITVFAIHNDVLPEVQHPVVINEIFSLWSTAYIAAERAKVDAANV